MSLLRLLAVGAGGFALWRWSQSREIKPEPAAFAPGETEPMNDAAEIRERFQKSLQAVVDAGACAMEPTTVIDLTNEDPVLVRQGRGELALLGL